MTYSIIHVAIAFGIGTVLGGHLPFGLPLGSFCGIVVGIVLLSLLLGRRNRGFLRGFLIAVALFGALRAKTVQIPLDSLYPRVVQLREVTGTVVSYPDPGEAYTAFDLVPDCLPAKIRVFCFWEGGSRKEILYGDRLRLNGSVRIPERYPDFDYRAYLARRGIVATMAVGTTGSIRCIGTGGIPLLRCGDRIRQTLLERLEQILSPREAGLAQSLLLGERAALEEEIEEAFHRTGLMHLLAVSGLHLGVLLAVFWFFLRRVGLRPLVTYPIVGIVVLFALWSIGPRVSLVRAALLFAFIGLGSVLADLGILLRRWVRPDHGLAAAALVILALDPTALWDVGFQLSFGATAAIVIVFQSSFWRRIARDASAQRGSLFAGLLRYALTLVAAAAAAQAGTAPFIAYHFGEIYPIAFLSNLVAVPIATIVLWSGLITLLFVWTPLVYPVGLLFTWTLRSLAGVVEGIAHLPFAVLWSPPWMGVWVGGIVIYLFAAVFYGRGQSS